MADLFDLLLCRTPTSCSPLITREVSPPLDHKEIVEPIREAFVVCSQTKHQTLKMGISPEDLLEMELSGKIFGTKVKMHHKLKKSRIDKFISIVATTLDFITHKRVVSMTTGRIIVRGSSPLIKRTTKKAHHLLLSPARPVKSSE